MQVTFNPSIMNNRSKKQNPVFEGYYLEKPVPLRGLDGLSLKNRLLDSDTFGTLKTTASELIQAYKQSDSSYRPLFEDLFVSRNLEFPPNLN